MESKGSLKLPQCGLGRTATIFLAEGEGFEPPKACTLVVFKIIFDPSTTVRRRSPTSALYFALARFVH